MKRDTWHVTREIYGRRYMEIPLFQNEFIVTRKSWKRDFMAGQPVHTAWMNQVGTGHIHFYKRLNLMSVILMFIMLVFRLFERLCTSKCQWHVFILEKTSGHKMLMQVILSHTCSVCMTFCCMKGASSTYKWWFDCMNQRTESTLGCEAHSQLITTLCIIPNVVLYLIGKMFFGHFRDTQFRWHLAANRNYQRAIFVCRSKLHTYTL